MSSVITLSEGASEAQIQDALNALGDGGTLVLPANQIIAIRSGLVMDVASRSITIDLNGSTLQQAGDVSVLTVRGGHAAEQGAVLGEDASGRVTVTTSGAAPAASLGDFVKVYSDSVLPNDHGSATRLGQAMEVVGVDGNRLTLKGELVDAELYVDNIRVSKFLSGTPTVENGTIRGDQSHSTWVKDLVQVRSVVDADLHHLTVRDGNSMGINIVDSVNAQISQVAAINLLDNTAAGQTGYAVHSASSVGTTVRGLYAEDVRHATDNNAVGITTTSRDPSRYGADLGMDVSDVVANATTAAAFSWHTEGRGGLITDSVVFNSYGVLGARGLDNSMRDVAGSGNARGIQFYEYGDGDGRDITVDNVQLRATTYYAYTSTGDTANNVVSNSTFDILDKKLWVTTGITSVDSIINILAWGTQNNPLTLVGTGIDDRLTGAGGSDTIQGGAGGDYLWGGKGADFLCGGAGNDRFAYLSTDEGGDIITDFTTGAYGDAIDLSAIAARNGWKGDIFAGGYVSLVQSGADTLVQVDANGGGDAYVTLATLQNVNAGAAHGNISTEIHVTGGAAVLPPPPEPAPIVTLAPVDPYEGALRLTVSGTLTGTSASETLLGSEGNDTLLGNDGDDTLIGGAGSDQMNGGAGSNLASYATSATGLTADLQTPSANSGDAAGDSYSQIARLEGSAFGDNLYGNSGANTIGGAAGDDRIDGRSGSDRLYGGEGADSLFGGSENDGLYGEAGDDRLAGGTGYDSLTGGAGADSFVLERGDNWETITDFTPGEDHIVLVNFAITSFSPDNFVASTAPKAIAAVGTILYDSDDGILSWDADGTGAGYATKIAVLTGHPDLIASDFLFG